LVKSLAADAFTALPAPGVAVMGVHPPTSANAPQAVAPIKSKRRLLMIWFVHHRVDSCSMANVSFVEYAQR
jgi:hypothetical protein